MTKNDMLNKAYKRINDNERERGLLMNKELSTKDAAKILGCSESNIGQLVFRGILKPSRQVGGNLFHSKDIEALRTKRAGQYRDRLDKLGG